MTDTVPKLGLWIGFCLLNIAALLVHLTQLGLHRVTGKWPFNEPMWLPRARGNLWSAGFYQ